MAMWSAGWRSGHNIRVYIILRSDIGKKIGACFILYNQAKKRRHAAKGTATHASAAFVCCARGAAAQFAAWIADAQPIQLLAFAWWHFVAVVLCAHIFKTNAWVAIYSG